MRRGINQGQVVNNLFTFISVAMLSIIIILYVNFNTIQDNIKARALNKISCQKNTYYNLRVFNKKLLNSSLKALSGGYYKITGTIKYKEKDSILKDFVSNKEIEKFYKNALKIPPLKKTKRFLLIKYELIENKSLKIKTKRGFYSGSIKTTFMAGDKKIFTYLTDFFMFSKKEIEQKINCTLEVYKNYAKNY